MGPEETDSSFIFIQSQWLNKEDHQDHDISSGLRENWEAARRWKKAISGVQAAVRMNRAALAARASNRSTPRGSVDGDSDASHTSYNTATEDEGESTSTARPAGPATQQRPLPSSRADTEMTLLRKQTQERDAKAIADGLHRDMTEKMSAVEEKARELSLNSQHQS